MNSPKTLATIRTSKWKRVSLSRFVSGLFRNARGGVVITFALALPLMLVAVGGAIDYGYMSVRKTALQGAADAAALAAAREMQIANADKDAVNAVAKTTALANLEANPDGISIRTRFATDPITVGVAVRQSPGLIFLGQLLGMADFDITVRAVARVAGDMAICLLILDENSKAALALKNRSRITGNGCAVYSNSTSSAGIDAKKGVLLLSKLTCSAGGYSGGSDSFAPLPLTDCPPIEDPLAGRMPPPVGSCIEDDLKIEGGTRTLVPGTYCGDLTIDDGAVVTFEPGIYVIDDGQFHVTGGARVIGENVGFYLHDDSNFKFSSNSTIELSAPKDGDMAGLLFFEDRDADDDNKHTIKSNGARSLIGTIYLPRGQLTVDATKPLFDQSAYTVIITRELNMFSGPNLMLNSNYADSDIPVPSELEGASGAGDRIVLIR